ncbi:MAG: 5-dehydro-4-deoxy-D-glucuronate isomerase, partial [Hymenobacter sp.]|nr:5-dehydro-4-deoxy-D-glucuronate isomerase [Hymenobacter sp.]
MTQRYASSSTEMAAFTTADLRKNFLIETIFETGQVHLVYSHYDRLVVGGAMPGPEPLELPCPEELKAEYFLERRELGILNVGGAGRVTVDGVVYQLGPQDCLYVGRGAQAVQFERDDERRPAKFYVLSAPAHCTHPTTRRPQAEATPVEMGNQSTANRRTIYKYIYAEGIQSCQLVMGLTQLRVGNVWNTMPAHTHDRRTEAYLYFNLPPDQRVLHLMGQ